MKEVLVRDADGFEKRLALVSHAEGIAMVCAQKRFSESDPGAALEYAVGLPAHDVRWADTGEPLDTPRR